MDPITFSPTQGTSIGTEGKLVPGLPGTETSGTDERQLDTMVSRPRAKATHVGRGRTHTLSLPESVSANGLSNPRAHEDIATMSSVQKIAAAAAAQRHAEVTASALEGAEPKEMGELSPISPNHNVNPFARREDVPTPSASGMDVEGSPGCNELDPGFMDVDTEFGSVVTNVQPERADEEAAPQQPVAPVAATVKAPPKRYADPLVAASGPYQAPARLDEHRPCSCCAKRWQPLTDSEIDKLTGFTDPSKPMHAVPLFDCTRLGASNWGNHAERQYSEGGRRRYLLEQFWLLRFFDGKKRSNDATALLQSWNQFVVNGCANFHAILERVIAAEDRFIRFNPQGKAWEVHRACHTEQVSCAVPQGVNCPLCKPGAPRISKTSKIFEQLPDFVKKSAKELYAEFQNNQHQQMLEWDEGTLAEPESTLGKRYLEHRSPISYADAVEPASGKSSRTRPQGRVRPGAGSFGAPNSLLPDRSRATTQGTRARPASRVDRDDPAAAGRSIVQHPLSLSAEVEVADEGATGHRCDCVLYKHGEMLDSLAGSNGRRKDAIQALERRVAALEQRMIQQPVYGMGGYPMPQVPYGTYGHPQPGYPVPQPGYPQPQTGAAPIQHPTYPPGAYGFARPPQAAFSPTEGTRPQARGSQAYSSETASAGYDEDDHQAKRHRPDGTP
jgi:hypothetical protein